MSLIVFDKSEGSCKCARMRQIVEFENYYIVEDGRVYNSNTGLFLNGGRSRYGYCNVSLSRSRDKYHKIFDFHRLAAEYFLENPHNLPCITHLDKNVKNNSVSNLKWSSITDCRLNTSSEVTSICKGITFDVKINRWRACYLEGREFTQLGIFHSEKEAYDDQVHFKNTMPFFIIKTIINK
jgi:hypothetical protein